MTFEELVRTSRSIRRFDEGQPLVRADLEALAGLARFAPSAGNLQPLRYLLSHTPERNARVFECLGWAAYLKDWPGPDEGERPTGYIIILGDTSITDRSGCDHGIAAQTIMLGAAERGWGGCIVGAINRDRLRQTLGIPARYQILLVLALGKPGERVVIEDVGEGGDIRYWRDEAGTHHVPKRQMSALLLDL